MESNTLYRWVREHASPFAVLFTLLFVTGSLIIVYAEGIWEELDPRTFLMLLGFLAILVVLVSLSAIVVVQLVLSFGDAALTRKMCESERTFGHYLESMQSILVQNDKLKDMAALMNQGVLIDTEQLIALEKERARNDIWVLTSFLEMENRPEMRDAIVSNLLEGVTYTYVIPDVADKERQMRRHIATWLRLVREKHSTADRDSIRDRIEYILVPDHFPYMTVLVYEPSAPVPDVVVKFPYREEIDKGSGSKEVVYERWMLHVNSEADSARIRNCIRELIESAHGRNQSCARARKGASEDD